MKVSACDRCWNEPLYQSESFRKDPPGGSNPRKSLLVKATRVYTFKDAVRRVRGELCDAHVAEAKKLFAKMPMPKALDAYEAWLLGMEGKSE